MYITERYNIHAKIELLKTVLTHKYWLAVTLAGAFLCFFAFDRGGIVVFIEATFVYLVLCVLVGRYRLKTIPTAYWVTCSICACILLMSILVAPHDSHYRWMKYVLRLLALVFGIHSLSQKKIDAPIIVLFGIAVSLAVCWQFTALHFFGRPSGAFSGSIHRLAMFAVLIIPVIFYFFWISNGWYRYLWIVLGLMAIDLLLQTGSRPAFLGITSGTVFVTIFLVKHRYKWIGLASIILILVALFVTDYAGFAARIYDFFDVWREEERIQLWTKAWHTLKENSASDWIFGNGVGYFRVMFTPPGKPDFLYISPHNYFLHLVYSSGITGVILVTAGFALLVSFLFNVATKNQDINIRVLANCLIVTFISWLTLCGLNFSLFSKYSLYPLAYVLGPMLVVIQQKNDANKAC
jgi:hypothetical protein